MTDLTAETVRALVAQMPDARIASSIGQAASIRLHIDKLMNAIASLAGQLGAGTVLADMARQDRDTVRDALPELLRNARLIAEQLDAELQFRERNRQDAEAAAA